MKRCLVMVAALVAAGSAADTVQWTGASAADQWSDGGNWFLFAPPVDGDTVVFDANAAARLANDPGQGWRLAGLVVADAPGAVTLTNSVPAAVLTNGAGGLDLSAATADLSLLVNLELAEPQTWNVAGARTLNLHTLNSGRTLTGTGAVTLVGGGTVVLKPGTTGSVGFNDAGSFSGYAGTWTLGTNVLVTNIRNGRTAFGAGSIRLEGGTLAQVDGNWTWTTPIEAVAGFTSTLGNRSTGAGRALKLQGTLSGGGTLVFDDTVNTLGADTGIILTGTNTCTGLLQINPNTEVRVGGVPGDDVTTAAGPAGTLGAAAVTNDGALTFSRSDAWTVSNAISGAGAVRIGGGVAGAATQLVIFAGANKSYTGVTQLAQGVLRAAPGERSPASPLLFTGASGVWDVGAAGSHTVALGVAAGEVSWAAAGSGGFAAYGGAAEVTLGGAPDPLVWAGTPHFLTNSRALIFGSVAADAPLTFPHAMDLNGAQRTITVVDNPAATADVAVLSRPLGGTGASGLRKNGDGMLVLAATNTYGGATAVDAGQLRVAVADALPDGSACTVAAGATLDLGGYDETIGALAGAGLVTGSAGRLTFGGGHLATTFSGTLAELGGLHKTGGATFVLSGALHSITQLQVSGSGYLTEIGPTNYFGLNTTNVTASPHVDLGSPDSKGDYVLFGVWLDATNRIASLRGAGNIRCDAGGAGVRTLRIEQDVDTVFSGRLLAHRSSGAADRQLTVLKQGVGTLTLAGASGLQQASAGSYAGGTTRLTLAAEAGRLVVNGTVGGVVRVAGGTLGGTGRVGTLELGPGHLDPGTTPDTAGLLIVTNGILRGDTLYIWNLADAAGPAGAGFDAVTATRAFTNEAPGGVTTIRVVSINGGAPGLAANFNPAATSRWPVLTAAGGLGNVTAGDFALDTSGFANPTAGGSFSVEADTGSVYIVFTAAAGSPEPYDLWAAAIPNPAQRGDQEDPDGDGYANLWEYSQGTDPTNSAAGIALTGFRTNGAMTVKFNRATGAVDLVYLVESAGVPTNGADWTVVASNGLGAGWSGLVSETNSGPVVQVFATDPAPGSTNRALRLHIVRP